MLKRAHLGLFIALFLFHPVSDVEARMNKCTDGMQTTYTSEPCERLGLDSAGPIKDLVTIVPVSPKPQMEAPGRSEEAQNSSKDTVLNKEQNAQPPATGDSNPPPSVADTTGPESTPEDKATGQ